MVDFSSFNSDLNLSITYLVILKDNHREKVQVDLQRLLKYEYGHLDCWYIKLILFKRF